MLLHCVTVIESLNIQALNEEGTYNMNMNDVLTLLNVCTAFSFRLISFAKLECHLCDVSNLFKFKLLYQVPLSELPAPAPSLQSLAGAKILKFLE